MGEKNWCGSLGLASPHWHALPIGNRSSSAHLAFVVELTVVSSHPALFGWLRFKIKNLPLWEKKNWCGSLGLASPHWHALPIGNRSSSAHLAFVVELTVVSSHPALFGWLRFKIKNLPLWEKKNWCTRRGSNSQPSDP